jgi:serine/threonine protein kinase
MSLAPSTRLGPYEILSPLGSGGMGEVYRARDPRMGREVAIKISAERFSDRFEREVRAVAALNHPNICQIYDVGPNYLVMELIEGPTLAERIKQGALPLEEALAIARQIGDALEAAHEKGIIHRDLKPANIKIKAEGAVKVLDFGLAKMADPAAAVVNPENSPTVALGATVVGQILGTAAYMAPEQARGKTVDKRADIWAFGVVLYEMLTGRRLFEGETISDTLASVLTKEPDCERVPAKAQRLLVTRRVGRMHIVCYLRQASNVFETYWTTSRGVEVMDNSCRLLDLTVYGRQETWEGSPTGWPQGDIMDTLRTNGRPTSQWPRLKAGYSDDLGTGRH